jgi:2'-5' RNA ligase
MRVFTGLDLPEEVVGNLEGLLARLGPAAHIKWSPAANLHITTKFIGAWSEERLAELKAALSFNPLGPIPVHIRKLGFFPNPHSPRIFYCGVEAPGLDVLAEQIDSATSAIGIPAEKRPFSPHLTLARIKERPDLQPLREAIAALGSSGAGSMEFGQFEARSFFLYQSTPRPNGSVYTKLAEFPLFK